MLYMFIHKNTEILRELKLQIETKCYELAMKPLLLSTNLILKL